MKLEDAWRCELDELLKYVKGPLQKDRDDLISEIHDFRHKRKRLLLEAVPEIPNPATHEDVHTGVETFQKAFKKVEAELQASQESMLDRCYFQIDFRELCVERHQRQRGCYEGEKKKLLTRLAHYFNKWKCMGDRELGVLNDQSKGFSKLGQIGLHRLVKRQSSELRQWFYDEYLSQYGSHLTKVSGVRPQAIINPNRRPCPSTHLPLEVMSIIFCFAPVESCINLREVNSSWYSAFYESHQEMKWRAKLMNRNPWMRPGDPDLKTWADCMLVFGRRVKSDKWKLVNELENIPTPELPPKYKTVVEFKVDGEDVSQGILQGMLPDRDVDCELHSEKKYLLSSNQKRPTHEVVYVGNDATVIKHNEVEIVLAPNIRPDDIGFVQHGETTIKVFLKDGKVAAFPKETPHYYYGVVCGNMYSNEYEIGGVFVSEDRWMKECQFGLAPSFSQVRNYYFADWNRRQMIELETAVWWGRPVAYYNGALWWGTRKKEHYAKHETFYPIFIDIQQPNRGVYYRTDGAMWGGAAFGTMARCSQAKGLSNYHSAGYGGWVYDFARREITKFEPVDRF